MTNSLNVVSRWIVLLSLVVAVGCDGFDKLKSGDKSLEEEEVFAAANADDGGGLTANLHDVLSRNSEYSTEVVVAAIAALGERGEPASVPFIASLAEHENEEVRWHVAVALKQLGGEEANQVLARMVSSDESDMVRSEAAGK